ncbi:MAG: phosphoribosylglycinamide formyltransferase [Bacillota bacterium]|nr:phosphoribosylglycinamide formyltransferase [Bacillota bacterium]
MGKVNIAVLISGSGTNLQAVIDSINKDEINGEIKLVISNKQNAFGLKRAEKERIKNIFLDPKNLNDENYDKKLIFELEKESIDLIILAGYLKILTINIIKKYENKIINIHPSLIPCFSGKKYYGVKVHEEAIKYGVKVSGATTHFVNDEPDGGPIIIQETVKVDYSDTAESLQKKVLKVEHKILTESIRLFCEDKLEVVGRKVKIKQ